MAADEESGHAADATHNCPDCGATELEAAVTNKLGEEINQAINRAVSKLGTEVNVATLAMPLVINATLVFMRWEETTGNTFEDCLNKFVDAAHAYREDILADRAKGKPTEGNA